MHPMEESAGASAAEATMEMPRYVSHKKVWALEIFAVGAHLNGLRHVVFADKGYAGVPLPEEMFSRYVPVKGDYYVVYSDGYKSFSPRKAFLEGYRSAERGD